MDLAFISLLVPDELSEQVSHMEKIPMERVSSFIQAELIKGLMKCGNQVSVFNRLHIGSFPHQYKKLIIKKYNFSISTNEKCKGIGFINSEIFTRFFFFCFLGSSLKSWASQSSKAPKAVLCYALTNYNLDVIKHVKKFDPTIKTSIIIPDLPEYMSFPSGRFTHDFLRRIYLSTISTKLRKTLPYIDRFFLFSEPMADYFDCRNRFTIIEGVSKEDIIKNIVISQSDDPSNRVLYYAGVLSEEYGIMNLIDAFEMIDNPQYELILCGRGSAVQYVKDAAKRDPRIHYLGTVQYAKALSLMNSVDIVINPRIGYKYDFTKYSFPSKNMDTMSYGKPLIGYRLEGIPSEYDDYIIYVNGQGPIALKDAIVGACSLSKEELKAFGNNARTFVLKNKNGYAQATKIHQALNGAEDEK